MPLPKANQTNVKWVNHRSLVILIIVVVAFHAVYFYCGSNSSTTSLDLLSIGIGDEPKQRLEVTQQLTYNDPAFEMNAIPAPDFHLVISTGCSTYQDWQSYALFYHAMKSGQVNTSKADGSSLSYVTRVVSGCDSEQATKMNEYHARAIATIAPGRFFIHHAPAYQFTKPKVDYKFFNKPLGYQHWMVNALRYPYNHEKYDNVTYILLDPDQIMLRPFKNNYTDENEIWGGPFRGKRVVERGQPFAQQYAMGVQYLMKMKPQMPLIAPKNELPSPIENLTRYEALAYQVGPPYIMKGFDMWKIINTWAAFVPYVFAQQPEHLAEMYAYSAAAAHLKLPHQIVQSFMISNVAVNGGEGWELLDGKASEDVCGNVQVEDMPHVIHFCQEYGIGKYFFSKYRFPKDFISCASPLLKEPPSNVANLYKYMIHPGTKVRLGFDNDVTLRRATFAACYMIKSLNDAAVFYKEQHCEKSKANFNRTLAFFGDMEAQ